MKIACIYDDRVRPDSTAVYFGKALQDMGHDVKKVYPENVSRVDGGFDLYLFVDHGLESSRMNPKLHPSVYYAIDTHLDPGWRLDFEREGRFDLVFCAQKAGVSLPWQAPSVQWLPLAADKDQHYVGKREKKYDVAFIGNFHSVHAATRLERVDKLFKALPNFFYGTRFFTQMAEKFSESKLVFNSSLNKDINMRFFEAMMSGSCLLTDYIPEMDALGFKNGVHYVGYENDEDMLQKAKALVEADERRELIADAGHMEVFAHHTYQKRCEKILERVEELKSCLR